MLNSTEKRLVNSVLKSEKTRLELAIESCSSREVVDEKHVSKLNRKILLINGIIEKLN